MDAADTLDDGDDEDVIFYGSPIYTSVVNSGCLSTELEADVVDTINHKTKHKPSEQILVEPQIPVEPQINSVRWFGTKIWKRFTTALGFTSIPNLHQQHRAGIVCALRESACLEEEDAEFLHWYVKEPVTDSSAAVTYWNPFSWCLLVFIPCLCAYGYQRVVTPFPWRYTTPCDIGAIVVAICLAAIGVSLIQQVRMSRRLQREKVSVSEFVRSAERLISLLKKSIRLIQETELVARGFTLVSQRGVLSGMEGGRVSRTRQCPGLRKRAFHTCRQSIHFLRDETRTVLQTLSDHNYEIQSTYLAFEPIESYGPCLQGDEKEDEEHLYDLTDGFSVSALKGIFHLFTLHQSEFIKGFTLVYDKSTEQLGSSSSLLGLIGEIQPRLTHWTSTLQMSYDFHSTGMLNKEPSRKSARVPIQIDSIHVAVHSLDLHLQSALTRVRSLNALLEKQMDDDQPAMKDFLSHDSIDSLIQPISAELESCKGCWEEGVNRIEKFLGKSHAEGTDDHRDEPTDGGDRQEEITPVARPAEDYIIEDQVFEAYTDPNEVCMEEGTWDELLTPEEKERKRQEKLEALKMLTELKNVIKVRAEDTERREHAALMKYRDQTGLPQAQDVKHNSLTNTSPTCDDTPMDSIDTCHSQDICHSQNMIATESSKIAAEGSANIDGKNKETENDSVIMEIDPSTFTGNLVETLLDNYSNQKKTRSYVTTLGVRRLRKNNMLELSDSDSDTEEIICHKNTPETLEHEKHAPDTLQCDKHTPDTAEQGNKHTPDTFEGYNVSDKAPSLNEEFCKLGGPGVNLEERLGRLPGANLGFTSGIAAMAAARSHQLGRMQETMFGGEVFGEKSDSGDDAGDEDDDDDDATSGNGYDSHDVHNDIDENAILKS